MLTVSTQCDQHAIERGRLMYPSMHCCMSDLPVLQTASDQGGGVDRSILRTDRYTDQSTGSMCCKQRSGKAVSERDRESGGGGGVYSSGISLASLHITCSRLAPWPEVE